ncbi:hypothetical protein ACQ3G6_04575 [Allorhizobium undicola]|uniref:hypothetical protein n=1 Tax=Allorhizobium undicola TaxID=78527 RepID=UPI0004884630|nr:hypothetical protein [Allorhizobium undicola]
MKSLFYPAFTVACLCLAASNASAIGRYDTPAMDCSSVRNLLRQEGAAILRHPSTRVAGMTLYDRYVSETGFCQSGEYAERATVPTRDNRACPVLNCQPVDNLDDGFMRIIPRHRL